MNRQVLPPFLYTVFLLTHVAPAQTRLIDSLEAVLRNSRDSRERVDLLVRLSDEYKGVDSGTAADRAYAAIDESRHADYAAGTAAGYRALGNVSYYEGAYQAAIAPYDRARLLFDSLADLRKLSAVTNDLGLMFYFLGEIDTAIVLMKASLAIDEERKDTAAIAASYVNLALICEKQGRLQEAVDFAVQAMILDSLTGQWAYYAEDLGNVSTLYKGRYDFTRALSYALRGYAFADSIGARVAAVQSASSIGDIYQLLGQYASAEAYLTAALEKAYAVGKSDLIGTTYGRLQLSYQRQGEVEKALAAFDSALVYAAPVLKAQLFNNVGELYENQGQDPDRAETYYRLALDSARAFGQAALEVKPLVNLAARMARQGRTATATAMLQEALDKNGQNPLEAGTLRKVADIYDQAGDFKHSNRYLQEALAIQDSMAAHHQRAQARLLSYEKEIRELKIRRNAEQLRNRNRLSLGLLAGLVLLAALAYQGSRTAALQRQRKEDVLKMSAEMHHRIRNNLATIASLIAIKGEQVKDAESRSVIRFIQNNVIITEKIHAQFYRDGNALHTGLKRFLEKLLSELVILNDHSDGQIRVHQVVRGREHQIETNLAIEIGKLLNEVLTNAFKYTGTNNPSPVIRVEADIREKELLLQVSNNGPALPEGFLIDALDSFGLKWVKGICESLGWPFHFQNESGQVVFRVSVPLQASAK